MPEHVEKIVYTVEAQGADDAIGILGELKRCIVDTFDALTRSNAAVPAAFAKTRNAITTLRTAAAKLPGIKPPSQTRLSAVPAPPPVEIPPAPTFAFVKPERPTAPAVPRREPKTPVETKAAADASAVINAKALERALKTRRVADAYGGMVARGTVQATLSADVAAAFKNLLTSTISSALGDVAAFSVRSLIRAIIPIPGLQREGLVTKPTVALIGEDGPEFVISQERMRGLLSGGRAGYEFGPRDFGVPAPHVTVPPPQIEIHVAPDAYVNVRTAYRARAGEVELAAREA